MKGTGKLVGFEDDEGEHERRERDEEEPGRQAYCEALHPNVKPQSKVNFFKNFRET